MLFPKYAGPQFPHLSNEDLEGGNFQLFSASVVLNLSKLCIIAVGMGAVLAVGRD